MSPPGDPPGGPFAGVGALLNIGNTLQSVAQNIIQAVTELQQMMPAHTSGQASASKLIITGFVRVTGVSVAKAATPPGMLYDAPTLAMAAAGTEIYPLPSTVGYTSLQMIFANGLVYKAGTGEEVTVFYVRS